MADATVLFTGGKDSVFALHEAVERGIQVRALASVIPLYRYSMLFHQPYLSGLIAQSQSLSIPLETIGSIDPNKEAEALHILLSRVKRKYGVKVLITGAVKSVFQYKLFNRISEEIGLELYAPNWGANEEEYMAKILRKNIEFILVSVTSMGIPHDLLGRVFTWKDLEHLSKLSRKYGFNLSFEGGEAETFVINAPLFKYQLMVSGRKIIVSEYEGYFEPERISLFKKHMV